MRDVEAARARAEAAAEARAETLRVLGQQVADKEAAAAAAAEELKRHMSAVVLADAAAATKAGAETRARRERDEEYAAFLKAQAALNRELRSKDHLMNEKERHLNKQLMAEAAALQAHGAA